MVAQHHPPGIVGAHQLGPLGFDAEAAVQGGRRHPRRHQVAGGEVVQLKHLADHRGFIGFDFSFLGAQAGQQTDLLLIGAEFRFGSDGRQHPFQQQHQRPHHQAEPMQQGCAGQGHRQCQTASEGFGQDFPQQDHQDSQPDREHRQGHTADVALLKHPGGITAQHQAAENVEAVVSDHQS